MFDYNAGVGTTRAAGGSLTVSNVANFPALFANGMALAIGDMAYVFGIILLLDPLLTEDESFIDLAE